MATLDFTRDQKSPSARLLYATESSDSRQEVQQTNLNSPARNTTRMTTSTPGTWTKGFGAWQSLANKYWLYEIISCLVAILALFMLCLILAIFDGRARPQWPDYVSINTLIAIISSILKASLMLPIAEGISELKWQYFTQSHTLDAISKFDAASRGPWGSFLFLFHTRKHLLASLGAFLTICALAVDPFSQQVLKYLDCPEPSANVTARIPRTNAYTKQGYGLSSAKVALDAPMARSIYDGVLSMPTNASSLMEVSCPTGNCIFPSDQGASYSSVAICHQTEDISARIQNKSIGDWANYSLPDGPWAQGIPFQYLLASAVVEDASFFAFDTITIRLNSDSTQTPFAFRASLWPCVKTWGANVTHGILNETEVSSFPLDSLNGGVITQVADRTLRNGSWSPCLPSLQKLNDGDVAVTALSHRVNMANFTGTLVGNGPNDTVLYYQPDCLWAFNTWSLRAMSDFLTTLFQKNNVTGVSTRGGVIGDLWLQNLYLNASANMSTSEAYVANLAAHMTAHIRSNGDQGIYDAAGNVIATNTIYASGTALANQTCVHVRWWWLALPTTLTISSIVFLILMILSTHWTRRASYRHAACTATEPLKSSPLALLFHGIDPATLQASGYPRSFLDMQRVAESLEVRIRPSAIDGNWYFVHEKAE